MFRILESVIPKQEHLAEEVESLESPSNVTALAQTLFIDAYEKELEGYKHAEQGRGAGAGDVPRQHGPTPSPIRRLLGGGQSIEQRR